MGNPKPQISVVVTYLPVIQDVLNMTYTCIDDAKALGIYEKEWILVSNGETLPTFNVHTHVLNDTNLGNANAWDQGIGVSSGDIIILMDNDVFVEKDWDKEMVEKLADPTIGITFPRVRRGDEKEYRPIRDGCCFAFRRETYEKAGKFLCDQPFKLGYYEDDWFQYRVQHQSGLRLVSCPNSRVNHKGQATTKKIWSEELEKGIEANKEWYENKTDSVYPHLEK